MIEAAGALALVGALATGAAAGPQAAATPAPTITTTTTPAPAPAPAPPPPSPPDPGAQHAAEEANLVSNAPRSGLTFAIAFVGDTIIEKEVGRGGGLSLRLGHVATPRTIITFELTGGSLFHQAAMNGPTYKNAHVTLLAGAQYYVAPSFWLRFSGGLASYTIDDGPLGTTTHVGPGGCLGFGLDFARFHSVVVGAEGFGILSVSNVGLLADLALGLGVSFY